MEVLQPAVGACLLTDNRVTVDLLREMNRQKVINHSFKKLRTHRKTIWVLENISVMFVAEIWIGIAEGPT